MGDAAAAGGIMALLGGMMFVMMLPALVTLIAVWKVFTKAGKPGWAIIIPIYGNIVLLEIVGQSWTRLLWYLIPFYGLYLIILDTNALSKSFGKSGGFTAGLLLLGPIFGAYWLWYTNISPTERWSSTEFDDSGAGPSLTRYSI